MAGATGRHTKVTDDRSAPTPAEPGSAPGDAATVPVPHDEAGPGTSEETPKWQPGADDVTDIEAEDD
jgi:hypothetical protein